MRTSLVLMLAFALCSVSAGPLDPAKSLIEGFYTAYSGQDFSAPNCLSDAQQSDIVLMAEAIAGDFEDENSFALLFSHGYELYKDLLAVQTDCGLTALSQHLVEFVESEGVAAFVQTIQSNEAILAGFGLQLLQQLLQHEWQAAGSTLGEAVASVIPPEINAETGYEVQGTNFFQKLDNFTSGLFYGFATNPKKPVPCFGTYNETAAFFRNSSQVIEGCVRLYMSDCEKVRDLVPDAIIHLQGLVLSCKLEDLWASVESLVDPTAWSKIVITYYWNMSTITGLFNDLVQSYMFKSWKQMGVDAGSIIRILLDFKLN